MFVHPEEVRLVLVSYIRIRQEVCVQKNTGWIRLVIISAVFPKTGVVMLRERMFLIKSDKIFLIQNTRKLLSLNARGVPASLWRGTGLGNYLIKFPTFLCSITVFQEMLGFLIGVLAQCSR